MRSGHPEEITENVSLTEEVLKRESSVPRRLETQKETKRGDKILTLRPKRERNERKMKIEGSRRRGLGAKLCSNLSKEADF